MDAGGVEPPSAAYQAAALPLCYASVGRCQGQDLHLQHTGLAGALLVGIPWRGSCDRIRTDTEHVLDVVPLPEVGVRSHVWGRRGTIPGQALLRRPLSQCATPRAALRRGVEPLSAARQAVCDTGRITQDESPPGAIRTPNPAFGGRGPIHLAGGCVVRPAGFEPAPPRVGGAAPIQLGTGAWLQGSGSNRRLPG